MQLTVDPSPRPKVLVCSHERSGTHFLMNSLALNLGYSAAPRVDLDRKLGIDFHTPLAVERFLSRFTGVALRNLFKSHHQAGFLAPVLGKLPEFRVCYIHRDPADTLASLRRYLHGFRGDEGPRCESLGELMRAEPAGAMMRYQKRQHATLTHRWLSHVQGWQALAQVFPQQVHLVSYEALSGDFDATLRGLAAFLGLPLASTVRPDRSTGVIAPGAGVVGAGRAELSEEDRRWLDQLTAAVRPAVVGV